MRLYIDKENLISLIASKAQDSFEDCARVVRRELDVQYNFSKEDIKSDVYLDWFFKSFGQGVRGKQDFVPENVSNIYPPRPLKSNFYNVIGSDGYTAIYLLNDEHICDVISQKCCILIGKVGDETNVLASLLIKDSETPTYKINSWQDFCPSLPLSDIIICDNHYFKDKNTYEKNDNDIIRALVKIPKGSPINVIIITKQGKVDKEIDLSKEQTRIKEIVKKATDSKKSTVTILTTYSTHDRCLITNYYRIKHGSCFHLKENSLKKDVTTEIKTHLVRNNEEVTKDLLKVYQKIVNNAVESYGDKSSNLLDFHNVST